MVDLNTLIPEDAGSPLYEASNVNERGEIVAGGLPPGCGNQSLCSHVYVLIPCDDYHPRIEGCEYSMVDAAEIANNAAAPQSPKTILPTTDSLNRPINPSHNWFSQPYRTLSQ